MIIGTGCDVVDIERFRLAMQRQGENFLRRLFLPEEISYCSSKQDPVPFFSARFAAKEAVSKALGCGIGSVFRWHDVEIVKDSLGKPSLLWHVDAAQKFHVTKSHLSLSHSQTVAIAMVVLE